jgi:AP-2 complex subunit alpha
LRQQLSPTNPSIAPSGQQEQQFLFECIKPVAPGPNLAIQYKGSSGQRSHELKLPVLVTSFNEPLSLSGADFNARWMQLGGPGQEVQEMFTPSNPIDFQVLKTIVSMVKITVQKKKIIKRTIIYKKLYFI